MKRRQFLAISAVSAVSLLSHAANADDLVGRSAERILVLICTESRPPNLYYDFLHGTSARVADISVVSKEQALWAGLGIGASMNWNDDRYTVYGELLARTSVQDFGDSNAIGARLGIRYRW